MREVEEEGLGRREAVVERFRGDSRAMLALVVDLRRVEEEVERSRRVEEDARGLRDEEVEDGTLPFPFLGESVVVLGPATGRREDPDIVLRLEAVEVAEVLGLARKEGVSAGFVDPILRSRGLTVEGLSGIVNPALDEVERDS